RCLARRRQTGHEEHGPAPATSPASTRRKPLTAIAERVAKARAGINKNSNSHSNRLSATQIPALRHVRERSGFTSQALSFILTRKFCYLYRKRLGGLTPQVA